MKPGLFYPLDNCRVGIVVATLLCSAPLYAHPDQSQQADHQAREHSGKRVISLAPHLTEMVYAVGAGHHLVGRDRWSDYPAEAESVAVVSDAFSVNQEQLVLLQPDLALAWESGNPPQLLAQLTQLGIEIVKLEPDGLASIPKDLLEIGRLLGHEAEAERAARQFQLSAATNKERVQHQALPVFYAVSVQPLYTINGQHMINEMIERCGGENPFADLKILAPQIGIEALIATNPQVVLGGPDQTDAFWKRWPMIDAVKHDRIYTIKTDWVARAGPRAWRGLQQICEILDKVRANGDKSN